MKKLLKGFCIGLCNIIPGVCSATIAILVGSYEDILEGMSQFYNLKVLKKHLGLYVGIILGIIFGVIVLNYLYKKIPLVLTLIFLGIIIRNYPVKFKCAYRNQSYIPLYILGLLIVVSMFFLNKLVFEINYDNLNLTSIIGIIICSFLSGIAMILPGLSGALMLVVFNLYFPLLQASTNIMFAILNHHIPMKEDLLLIIVFGIAFIFSLVISSKKINELLKNKPTQFNYFVNGMILGSIINILFEIPQFVFSAHQLVISIILFILCCFIKLPLFKKRSGLKT